MDYSLLMGVHNIDLDQTERCEEGGGADQQCGSSAAAKEEFQAAKNETWKSMQLDFNTSHGPYEWAFNYYEEETIILKEKVFFCKIIEHCIEII